MQQSPAPSALLDKMLLCISVNVLNVLKGHLEVSDLLVETDKLPMKLLEMNKDKLVEDNLETEGLLEETSNPVMMPLKMSKDRSEEDNLAIGGPLVTEIRAMAISKGFPEEVETKSEKTF